MDLGNTAGATCAQISSLDAFRAATVTHTMSQSSQVSVLSCRPEPGLQLWEFFFLVIHSYELHLILVSRY